MKKILLVSKSFRIALYVLMWFVPLWQTMVWCFFYQMPEWVISQADVALVGSSDGSAQYRFLAWLVGLPANIVWAYMCITFSKILKNYENNCVFTRFNAVGYQSLGIAVCLYLFGLWLNNVVINIIFNIHESLLSNILEEFNLIYFIGIMIGVGMMLVGWVMSEGNRLSEEQESII